MTIPLGGAKRFFNHPAETMANSRAAWAAAPCRQDKRLIADFEKTV